MRRPFNAIHSHTNNTNYKTKARDLSIIYDYCKHALKLYPKFTRAVSRISRSHPGEDTN